MCRLVGAPGPTFARVPTPVTYPADIRAPADSVTYPPRPAREQVKARFTEYNALRAAVGRA